MSLVAKLVYSKEYGIVEITSENYQNLVIDGDKDAWILAVKGAGKISLDEWEDLEYNLRGLLVRVGIIDPNKDGAFLKKKVGNIHFFYEQRIYQGKFRIPCRSPSEDLPRTLRVLLTTELQPVTWVVLVIILLKRKRVTT